MRVLRASEIGSFLYCRRAWWYRKQGVPSQNQAELAAGSALHERHGRAVVAAGLLRGLAFLLLLAGLAVLAAHLTLQVL
jgi:CRISPR/Cas system-associated exonuclease Cas4 (RecB family)